MNRRSFLQQSGLAAGLSLLPWQHQLIRGLFPQAGEMTLLRNNVGFYTERGGTIGWLLHQDAIVVIDTQFPEQSQNLIDMLKKEVDRPVDLLINTHHHGDHTSGNIAFKGLAKKVVAHENSKANQKRVAQERKREDGQLYPDTTFSDEWSMNVGPETVTMRYFGAAHTNGDAITHFENANVVHMGDLVFNRRFPYIDKSAGANIQNWMQVLKSARKTFDKDTIFIFGHAGEGYPVTGTHDDLKAMENYLKQMFKTVKKAVKKGMSKEDIMKITSFGKAPEWKGKGIERSLSAALEELNQ